LQHFLQLGKLWRAARKAFAGRMLYCRSVLYLEKGRGKIPHSENANVSLKQSDLSHFIPGLAYHCGKKLDSALLIPVFVFMANRNIWSKAALRKRTDYKSIGNWPLSNMIYDSIGNWPLFCD